MTRKELAEAVQKEASLETKAQAERACDAVLGAIMQEVRKTKKCQLVGFGTFSLKNRKARMGRNPHTGQPLKIKASKSVGFKPSKQFKDSLK